MIYCRRSSESPIILSAVLVDQRKRYLYFFKAAKWYPTYEKNEINSAILQHNVDKPPRLQKNVGKIIIFQCLMKTSNSQDSRLIF